MTNESTSRLSRGARRTALGASLAMAAAGAIAVPSAFAAEGLTVSGTLQTGVAFNVQATGLTAGEAYRVILTLSANSTDTANVAEAGNCLTPQTVHFGDSLSCTLTESDDGDYQVKLLNAAGAVLKSEAVAVKPTSGKPVAPVATDASGKDNDKVTITGTKGVAWTVDGTTVSVDDGATEDVKVDDGAALVVAAPADGYEWAPGARTSWSFRFSTDTTQLQTLAVPQDPSYVDMPETAQDTVTVTKTPNIVWKVNGTEVGFAAGAATATVYSALAEKTKVAAEAADGYVFPGNLDVHWYGTPLTDQKADLPSTRLAGENRMDTAVEISKKYWTDSSKVHTVYVANGLRYADALAAGPAAAKDGAPLLLVMQDEVPANVLAEIKRLNPDRIHVVGGTSVVSEGVEQTLGEVATVSRLAGSNRYETAAKVSEKWSSAPAIYIALGENFPDALSGGSGAAHEKGALLLTMQSTLPQETIDAVKRINPGKVVLVGGTNVIAESVRLELQDATGKPAVRYAGADRYATSAAVAVNSKSASADTKTVFLATGLNFPDALAGVPAAHVAEAPLMLSLPTCLPASVSSVVNSLEKLERDVRLGSSGVLGAFPLSKVCG